MKELRDDTEKVVSSSGDGACTSTCADMCISGEEGATCMQWNASKRRVSYLQLEIRLVVCECEAM